MTEQEWENCTDPGRMLEFLRRNGRLEERKSRRFGVAACRRIWHLLTDERSRQAVEVVEKYAEGAATIEELTAAYEAAFDVGAALAERRDVGVQAARHAAWTAAGAAHPDELAEGVSINAAEAAANEKEPLAQVDLVR